ncbi:unnamed protein product [Mucor hiemalis]
MSSPNRPPTVTSAANSGRGTPQPLRNGSGQQYRLVIQQLNNLAQRLDTLEETHMRPPITPAVRPRLRDRTGYNSQLKYHFKLAYHRAVGTWDFTKSMKSDENILVLNEVKAIALQMPIINRIMAGTIDPDSYNNEWLEQTVEGVIRNQFDNLRKAEKKRALPAEVKSRKAVERRMIERKNRVSEINRKLFTFDKRDGSNDIFIVLQKLKHRREAFERLNDQLPIELDDGVTLERGECLPLLIKEVMSDEEDGEMFREGVASSFVVKRPRWRSDKVNRLFNYLDDLHRDGSTQFHQQRDRSVEVVAVDVSDELRRRLPSWAVEE